MVGQAFGIVSAAVDPNGGRSNTWSAIVTVVGGDYFYFDTRQTSGGNLNLNQGWFIMEIIE
jgi:hypothetical protein